MSRALCDETLPVRVPVSPRRLAAAARLGLAALLLTSSSIAPREENVFSRWAALHAVPLTTLEPSEDFSDLLPLKRAIGSVRVVALGEPTHGLREAVFQRARRLDVLPFEAPPEELGKQVVGDIGAVTPRELMDILADLGGIAHAAHCSVKDLGLPIL